MNPFRLTVTQENIHNGCIGNEENCAIALALREMGFHHVWVSDYEAVFYTDREKYKAKLPNQAFTFMCCFDNMVRVDPATFDLVPELLEE